MKRTELKNKKSNRTFFKNIMDHDFKLSNKALNISSFITSLDIVSMHT